MLRSPRHLPQRLNRPVTPQTERYVRRAFRRPKTPLRQRWKRLRQRLQRRSEALRKAARRTLALAAFGVCALGVSIALFSPLFHVRRIRVPRSDPRIDVEQIQRSLVPLFHRHLFFLSPEEVERLLAKAVPDLAAVDVTKLYPSTLGVRLTLDPVIARLVIEDPNRAREAMSSGSGAGVPAAQASGDFLTTEGMYVTYAPAQVAAATGVLTLHIVDWGVRPVPGKQLVEPALLAALRAAEDAVSGNLGEPVKSRTVFVRAREIHLQTPRHALWFDLRSPLSDQIGRYRLFLRTVGANEAKQYVDLRLKEKIVYR